MAELIKKHIAARDTDVDRLEGIGALNFLALDDLLVSEEGEIVDPDSIIQLATENNETVFPSFQSVADDPFLQQLNLSGKKWIIITDESSVPQLVLNANAFLRAVLFNPEKQIAPRIYCHKPIIVTDLNQLLGEVLSHLKVDSMTYTDDVIDQDLILIWSDQKRVITGSDILGRLLRGIALRHSVPLRS